MLAQLNPAVIKRVLSRPRDLLLNEMLSVGLLTWETPAMRTFAQGRCCLRFYNLIAHGVTHQFAHRMQFQLAHDIGAVGFCRLDADA